MMVRRRMAVHGLIVIKRKKSSLKINHILTKMMIISQILSCGAVLGTSILFSAVPLPAATTSAATSTATAVFGWCAVPGGLCNPFPLFFPFYSHSLFFLFSFLSRPFFGVLGRFWGYLGARDAPLRVFGRTRRQKTPASS